MAKIIYEREPCGRCGGTGHYSFNPVDGTICFKCRGAKTVLTSKGAEAKAAVDALKADMLTMRAADVQVGQRVALMDYPPRKVTDIQPAGTTGNRRMRNGEWVDLMVIRAAGIGFTLDPDDSVRRTPNSDEFQRMIDLAQTLEGATIERDKVDA